MTVRVLDHIFYIEDGFMGKLACKVESIPEEFLLELTFDGVHFSRLSSICWLRIPLTEFRLVPINFVQYWLRAKVGVNV